MKVSQYGKAWLIRLSRTQENEGSNPSAKTKRVTRCGKVWQSVWFGTRRPQVRILPSRPKFGRVAQRQSIGVTYRGSGFRNSPRLPKYRRVAQRKSICPTHRGLRFQNSPCLPTMLVNNGEAVSHCAPGFLVSSILTPVLNDGQLNDQSAVH